MTKKQKKMLYRIIVAMILLIIIFLLPVQSLVKALLFVIPYLVIGYDILKKAVLGIVHGEVFDENFLMSVATLGAFLLGEYTEGVAVMLFYQIGELFQSMAVGKSRRNIAALMDIRPDYANIEDEKGNLEQVDPEDVEIGTVIVVRPGEKIPIDGVVVEGSSTLNTSALTGESVPRTVHVEDAIISGCVNLTGLLKIRTTKEFGESTVSKILELVENSSMQKAHTENFITKFARYYTPAVCYSALALAVLPPVLNLVLGNPADWSVWVIRALTFLVISCPCALVISIPLSFFGGIGGASASGILVKGSNYLEALAQTGYVVFDKTGTLTKGVFEVTQVCPTQCEEENAKERLLEYAAYAESYSTHPIAKSLREAYKQSIDPARVGETQEIAGCGLITQVEGRSVAAGNSKLLEQLAVECEEPDSVGTVVHIAVDAVYAGYIVINDIVKEHSREAIASLKQSGIRKTVMLTGDRKQIAEAVAAELGVDEVRSELLPADKVAEVERLLQEKKPKEKLAFVGDGINDAPVLSRADIGIAMGALGSDAAIEAADIVLMDDDPAKIALAMRISRKTLRIVYQNIVFALAVKGICLILGALGIANMWVAIFADVGVMVLAVLNAMRCLRVPRTGK
ncbi:MAG: cadmium-translocating P-type ATPase [Lachnospiraceae bacterium]|nr:cadmium-translocating P-type ATPase [Lachnospiraceae bacterium]